MSATYQDLAEHTTTLIAIIGSLGFILWSSAGVIAALYWRIISRIEKKLDAMGSKLDDCRGGRLECRDELRDLIETRVSKDDFKSWKEGRVEIWDALNHHTHDSKDGKVKR